MNITKPTSYGDPAFDGYISCLEQELTGYAALQAKQNAGQKKPITEPELKAFIMNSVENRIQAAIHKTEEIFKPISGMTVAYRIKQEGYEKTKTLRAEYNQDEHALVKLEEKKRKCAPDLSKRQIRQWIQFGTAAIAATDGYFAYESLRYASFSRMAAFISAIGVAFAIGLIIHVMAGYIAKSKTSQQFINRLLWVLIPAFVGFYVLGVLRASGYNEAADLNVNGGIQMIKEQSHVSPISLTIISFLLFTVALVFSIRYAKTDEERKALQDYDMADKEVREMKMKMQKTQTDIANIQADASRKQAEALATFEYALAIEGRLQAIARQTMNIYAETNLRHRTDGLVPEFFSNPPAFNFNLFFENIKNSNQ